MEYHADKMTKDFEIGEIDSMPPEFYKGVDSTPIGYIGGDTLSLKYDGPDTGDVKPMRSAEGLVAFAQFARENPEILEGEPEAPAEPSPFGPRDTIQLTPAEAAILHAALRDLFPTQNDKPASTQPVGKTNLNPDLPESPAQIERDLAIRDDTRFRVIPPLRGMYSPFEKFPPTIIDPLDLNRILLNKPTKPIISPLNLDEIGRLLGINSGDVPTQQTKGYTASRRGGFGDKPRFPNKPDSQGPKGK